MRELVGQSSWTEARLVAHLAELEARRLHLTASRSLFAYCQERLGLSQNEAYYRIVAARLGRKFPIVFELLEQRKVHLTALALIRDYVTADNHVELLNEVSGKTKEQILQLLAARQPRPDARAHIRKLPIRAGSIAAGPSGRLEPLSDASYRLELCIGAQLRQKLEFAADLMSHANPSRDLAIIVERALDELIEKLRKRRFGHTSQPRKAHAAGGDAEAVALEGSPRMAASAAPPGSPAESSLEGNPSPSALPVEKAGSPWALSPERRPSPSPSALPLEKERAACGGLETGQVGRLPRPALSSDWRVGQAARKRAHIASELKRQLVARDGASCSFVCDDGERCGARAFLQIHHEEAWAKGGPDTLDNLRLVCAAHNRLLAEREFGAAHVESAIANRRRAGTSAA
ncbi:MAG TPA: HNH endonuclease [Polyangiaceae bacterium]|nr:HNH endonuclease [Polyangiaceae bacterium]